ncbi:hypothetical protein NITMOv2_2757 [Nitrospira moscoviensis]|uniref:Uncharacterized protein n=1 Tax=Nitrospira moscoviensis TaxID=42253 RepID=A0A0K2GEX6_NITMO|nr:hypothetical protein NITMOv2_2757 [Nitrospira moscoviensis]
MGLIHAALLRTYENRSLPRDERDGQTVWAYRAIEALVRWAGNASR